MAIANCTPEERELIYTLKYTIYIANIQWKRAQHILEKPSIKDENMKKLQKLDYSKVVCYNEDMDG